MATITYAYKPNLARLVYVKTSNKFKIHLPRRCMVISVGILLAGLSIPFFMIFELLPLTLGLFFASLGLTGTGTVLALIQCGEQ